MRWKVVSKIAALIAGAASFAALISGQGAPAFEVASVKPATKLSPGSRVGPVVDPSRARFTYMTLPDLAAAAYQVRKFQISAPEWTQTAYFSIDAKLPERASVDQVPAMLQRLLEERFKLVVRRDIKEFAVYELTVADGPSRLIEFVPDTPLPKGGFSPMTLDQYAVFLSDAADQPVLNRTGLAGTYLFQLSPVAAEANQRRMEEVKNRSGAGDAVTPGPGRLPGILLGMGLKLDSRKVRMPTLVIERAERVPIEN